MVADFVLFVNSLDGTMFHKKNRSFLTILAFKMTCSFKTKTFNLLLGSLFNFLLQRLQIRLDHPSVKIKRRRAAHIDFCG